MTTTEKTIRELHESGNTETQKRLEQEFPSLFRKKSTLQQALDYLGEQDEDVVLLRGLESLQVQGHLLAYQKLVCIVKFKNERYIFDFDNVDEYKYFPYFYLGKDFRLNVVYGSYYGAICSARLCFKTRELAEETVKDPEVLELYRIYNTRHAV